MSYEFYKVLHVFLVIILVAGLGISFYSPSKVRPWSMLIGIATLLIFVSGMGLIARLGIGHGEPWPLWIKIKIVLWLLIGAGAPIMIKRFPQSKPKGFWGVLALVLAAITVVVLKV